MLGRRSFRPKVFLIWASALTLGLRGAGYLFDFLGNPSDLTASGHVVDSLGDPLPLEYSTADHDTKDAEQNTLSHRPIFYKRC
ncbi:hypothetical protein RRG08_003228 [Elysia crispata]|uniref:Uncharacterized protein n=1 Tax=Elysia crispata TaxID=231223 RepID=A0AAE1AYP6_9GAST|nr:hypothetical protein RRG08_003228 [Elysia crispata]